MKGGMTVQDMDRIYREYAHMVYKYLLVKTRDSGWAEELTQETFYRAVYSLENYNGECKVSTWLCQIAKHVWMQDLEKRKKHRTEELTENMEWKTAGMDEQLLYSEQKMTVMKALHGMKEPAREVMYLRIFGELSFKEIGEVMGRSETWARVTFYRGRKGLMKGEII
ncbi:sigma-70 family RNA polymerase sigma factor [Clostridium sp. MCC353]|uniref:RNA polymerase sigma factor n=1 Tax=Clostridium sp. MCC353 TaxID=2592646 RepID=UPI0031FE6220